MTKSPKTVRVKIDIPDEKWEMLCRETGETDPNKVADIALREFIKYREARRNPNA
jgi:hypothetical protein